MKIKNHKRVLFILIIVILAAASTAALNWRENIPDIKVLIVYSEHDNFYKQQADEAYGHYGQSNIANLTAEMLDIDGMPVSELSRVIKEYDLIYPVMSNIVLSQFIDIFESYVKNGGNLVVEGESSTAYPVDFLGGEPVLSDGGELSYPTLGSDYSQLGRIFQEYEAAAEGFEGYEPGGIYALKPTSTNTISIVDINENDKQLSICAINKYGKGLVFFTGRILPDTGFVTSFDEDAFTNGSGTYFNPTAQTSVFLYRSELAAIVSKKELGFAVKKVYGTNGRPAIAWQNHFEVLSAVKNESMQKWIDLCAENGQVASFSLTYGLLEWLVRYESVGYCLSDGSANFIDSYESDTVNDFYTVGSHPLVDGDWLRLAKYPEKFSYFLSAPLPYRAVPYADDFDNDGVTDLLCGSADGNFYYYKGFTNADNSAWTLDNPKTLTVRADSYSSPVLYNGDLISGDEQGNVLLFKQKGSLLEFDDATVIVRKPEYVSGYSVPDVFDINSDGYDDLIIGYGSGEVYAAYGNETGFIGSAPVPVQWLNDSILIENAAPRHIGNGNNLLAVGCADGYILIFDYQKQEFVGYLNDSTHTNYNGNTYLKFGEYSAPFFADINHDGSLDIICGRLEYGERILALDSPLFPYDEELKNAIKYADEHFAPIILHEYTNKYKSYDDEKTVLNSHLAAFEKFGIPTDTGANQHTWYTSNTQNPLQSIKLQYEMGLKWNFGFQPANSPVVPSANSAYLFMAPFYLTENGGKTMLLFNAQRLWQEPVAALAFDLPISVYYHTEEVINDDPALAQKRIGYVSDIVENNAYNNIDEVQMAKAFSAAINTKVKISRSLLDKLKGRLGYQIQAVNMDTSLKLYDEAYNTSVGVKIEPAERFGGISTNADVYYQTGNNLYAALNKEIKITSGIKNVSHIIRVNLPANIKTSSDSYELEFLDNGLMQAAIYSDKKLKVTSGDFKMDYDELKSVYTFTKIGEKSVLRIEAER